MTKSITLSSPSFSHEAEIPQRFTCEGVDVSPALEWSGIPPEARSIAVIVDDPDAPDPAAPKRTWVHWVVYDIPASSDGLPEDAEMKGLPEGARVGLNDWDRPSWGGPCPPIGRHRYFFRVYALDTWLGALPRPTRDELDKAMDGHVLAEGVLMGTYEKKRRA